MKFRGIIFDLDGTLVDSLEDIADSMNNVLQRYGFPAHDLQAYKHFIGNGVKNLVREALPESSRKEELINRYYGSMIEEYRRNCLNKTRPYERIVELLDELASFNLKLAVFSNKDHELTEKIVTALLPKSKFELVIGSRAEIPRKPNPFGALLISKKLGIIPENLVYVGDTDVDMKTANSAGTFAVGALWGFRSKEELIENGAKYLLNYPMELIQMLRT
ncbi:HAD family hydrolase [Desulfosporosinus sp. BG]|uniref:HAD family hydrolase n=1 Tax=Desulfosporosinus sp. BG TaxID=1633135 RepID=UPI00083AB74C|nr:HAD family hydrolase [Desulfosporosinus sp. BG]ODA39700.1 Phosphoglycolate phosphatase [Desulfosporosinus sp. BG]